MAVHRKRFRVEEITGGEMPVLEVSDEGAPMHGEIMAELRAIRAQMAKGGNSQGAHSAMPPSDAVMAQEVAEVDTGGKGLRAEVVVEEVDGLPIGDAKAIAGVLQDGH